jgi:ATP-dependent 26S proteasome regulatory subunit
LLLIGSYIFFLYLFLWICTKNQLCGFLVLLKEELQRTNLELDSYKEKIKENQEKIKLNKQLPYLVGNIVEVNYQALLLLILC